MVAACFCQTKLHFRSLNKRYQKHSFFQLRDVHLTLCYSFVEEMSKNVENTRNELMSEIIMKFCFKKNHPYWACMWVNVAAWGLFKWG